MFGGHLAKLLAGDLDPEAPLEAEGKVDQRYSHGLPPRRRVRRMLISSCSAFILFQAGTVFRLLWVSSWEQPDRFLLRLDCGFPVATLCKSRSDYAHTGGILLRSELNRAGSELECAAAVAKGSIGTSRQKPREVAE